MSVLDKFDRAALGSNWESPHGQAADGNGPLIMIDGKDGVEMRPVDVNDENCTGIYIGQEFTYNLQYAEVEYLEEVVFPDYDTYLEDYANLGVLLNAPAAVDGARREILFRLWPNKYYTAYGEIYWSIRFKDDAGDFTHGDYAYWDFEDLFDAPRIPVGTKLRLERIGDTVYAYVYSPDRNFWFLLGTGDASAYTDGYPGMLLYSVTDADDAQATNFRAGSDGDTFLSDTSVVSANIARGIPRTLTRDMTASAAGIRNLGGGGGGSGPSNGANPTNMPNASALVQGTPFDTNLASNVLVSAIWNYAGTQMACARSDGDIEVFTASTPFDMTSFGAGATVSPNATTHLRQLRLSPDGTKLYALCYGTNSVYEFPLSTPWDFTSVNAATANSSFSVNVGTGMEISYDGVYIYVNDTGGNLERRTMSTPWDLSSVGAVDYTDAMTGTTRTDGLLINSAGTKLWATDSGTAIIQQFTLATPWDTRTTTYDSGNNKTVGGGSNQGGIYHPWDRNEIYITWGNNGLVYPYTWT